MSAVIPALLTVLPTATVARIITFAVVGIYASFQSVVLGALIARARGWKPAGPFTLGRWGPIVNAVALAHGVAAIVIMSIKTPAYGPGFFDRWLVPISLGIIAVVGLLYLFTVRPQPVIREDARAEAFTIVGGSPDYRRRTKRWPRLSSCESYTGTVLPGTVRGAALVENEGSLRAGSDGLGMELGREERNGGAD